ncbi:cystathionine beta-lyase/cystathionine gamma-synthase [Idiomarina sp. A28L]|uniref:trans-sulfuration enzyme family protein n=1 Tax=Idiomarina sp. A28L TaxID=1036674 RepID=UPI0002138605|nr:PLP-dependent aspartate aminotransferase family protein [Idiomarina sp. A28L]EGN76328.1 cystathionine beta-lyase/cystathionine gamma-synthase [Idiomarina sp. A28L]
MTVKRNSGYSLQTRVAQALSYVEPHTKGLVPPTYPSTTYLRDEDNEYRSGLVYSRADNPTYRVVENVLADIEEGADALLFASGMAAAVTVFQALRPGDHVLAPKVMYWALRNWLLTLGTDWGLRIELVDMADTQAVKKALIAGETKLVWLETPGNPLWTISDIGEICKLAHAAGAKVAVDSTCATPVLSLPIALGADIVMHSATKYLNGHSDIIAGALVCARDDEFWQRIRMVRKQGGAVLSPTDANQLLRGMRTLELRVRQSSQTAQKIAEKLQALPAVTEVLYPGLASFPGHAVANKQMHGGFGGMLSVRLKNSAVAIHAAAHTKLWKRATSLGGVESLIEHRASVEGTDSPVPDDLLRLSVGIEDADELFADLQQAITSAS